MDICRAADNLLPLCPGGLFDNHHKLLSSDLVSTCITNSMIMGITTTTIITLFNHITSTLTNLLHRCSSSGTRIQSPKVLPTRFHIFSPEEAIFRKNLKDLESTDKMLNSECRKETTAAVQWSHLSKEDAVH